MSRAAAAVVLIAAGAGFAWWYASRPRASGAPAVTGTNTDDYLGFWFVNPYTDTAEWDSTVAPADPDGYVDQGVIEDYLMPVIYSAGAALSGITGGRMFLSLAGLNAIKQHEKFVSVPYKDQAGLWTIGYGHKIEAGESFTSLTEAQASTLLAKDVGKAEDAVNASVHVGLTQHQFDALVSFVFNVGTGAFRRSTLLKKLNNGDPTVAAEFTRWVYVTKGGQKVQSAGLLNRRQAEVAMFNGTAGGYYS